MSKSVILILVIFGLWFALGLYKRGKAKNHSTIVTGGGGGKF